MHLLASIVNVFLVSLRKSSPMTSGTVDKEDINAQISLTTFMQDFWGEAVPLFGACEIWSGPISSSESCYWRA